MKEKVLYDLRELGDLKEGIFLERPNRFVALVRVGDEVQRVHVADTGRLEEILMAGRRLLLRPNPPGMKTDATLIAAKMEEGWVLINTRLHPILARRAIERGVLGFQPLELRGEVPFGRSRFDYLADDMLVELKGCSLVQEGKCLFPNAPTSRGTKHLRELAEAKERGYRASILIMALRPCRCFAPHPERDPAFRRAFYEALKRGVEFHGFFVRIEEMKVLYAGELKLCRAEGVSD